MLQKDTANCCRRNLLKQTEKGAAVPLRPRSEARYPARVCPEMPSRWHNTLRSLLVLEAAENLCSCSLGRRRSLKRGADSRGRQQRGDIFTPKICCQMCHATMPSWPRGYGLTAEPPAFSKAAPRCHNRETKLLIIPPNLPRFPNERDGACHPAHAR